MRRSILLLPLCVALAALSGCGNKGPLFMPPKPAPAPAPNKAVPPQPTVMPTTMPPAPASTAAQPAAH